MLNYFKFIEIIISLQSIFISTMIPVFITLPSSNNLKYTIEFPTSWQIPVVILITLLFKKKIIYTSLIIYIFLGLFVIPIFNDGGSLGYLLTPNFGYILGFFPLITIIDYLNKEKKIYILKFLKSGILGISALHLTGIFYNLFQILFHKQVNIFLYNIGKYSLGKIGYHFLLLIPIIILIKGINLSKFRSL